MTTTEGERVVDVSSEEPQPAAGELAPMAALLATSVPLLFMFQAKVLALLKTSLPGSTTPSRTIQPPLLSTTAGSGDPTARWAAGQAQARCCLLSVSVVFFFFHRATSRSSMNSTRSSRVRMWGYLGCVLSLSQRWTKQ